MKYFLQISIMAVILVLFGCNGNNVVPDENDDNETPDNVEENGVFFSDDFESGDISKTENGFTWSTENYVGVASTPNGTLGLRFVFGPDALNEDTNREQRFHLGKDYSDLWIKYDLYVPENYHHRCPSEYELEVAEQNMQVGDTVYKVDQSGTIIDSNYWGIVYAISGNYVWVDQLWEYFLFLDGDHMKNSRTGVVSQVKERNGYSANNKFMIVWQGGYGSTTTGNGISLQTWSRDRGSSVLARYLYVDQGTKLRNESHVFPTDEPLIDKDADGGKWMELIYHFKIASEADNDGIVHVMKNGVDYYNLRDIGNHSDLGYNYVDHGYLLGYSNSGFAEETTLYIDNVVFSTDSIAPGKF